MPVGTTTREDLASRVGVVGESVNGLRDRANAARFPYVAGLIRAAEEALVTAMNMLNDPAALESDL